MVALECVYRASTGVLLKVNRASMYNALEVRGQLLDRESIMDATITQVSLDAVSFALWKERYRRWLGGD